MSEYDELAVVDELVEAIEQAKATYLKTRDAEALAIRYLLDSLDAAEREEEGDYADVARVAASTIRTLRKRIDNLEEFVQCVATIRRVGGRLKEVVHGLYAP